MRTKMTAVAFGLAAAAGVSACSSSGGLPGGIASTSCKITWEVDFSNSNVSKTFSTESAAQAWFNGPAQQGQLQSQSGSGSSGLFGGGAPEAQPPYPVSNFSITAGQTVDVGQVTVAYYTNSGTEISSSQIAINQTLTSGQSGNNQGTSPPSNVASCKVVAWTPPSQN